MGDLTPRLDLYLPGGGSSGTIADEPADIDKLNDNFRRLDDVIGAQTVTSTTRPPAPYDGQLIRESDTRKLLVYVEATTSWELLATGDILAVVDLTALGAGWSPTNSGTHKPRLIVEGDRVTMAGAVTSASGASLGTLLTIPEEYRIAIAGTSFLGPTVDSAGIGYMLTLSSTGNVGASYGTGSLAVGRVMPLKASWNRTHG